MTRDTEVADILQRLPSVEEVRSALSRAVREAEVLRRLLRVMEMAEQELEQDDK